MYVTKESHVISNLQPTISYVNPVLPCRFHCFLKLQIYLISKVKAFNSLF